MCKTLSMGLWWAARFQVDFVLSQHFLILASAIVPGPAFRIPVFAVFPQLSQFAA
jgi:hypothetical protein